MYKALIALFALTLSTNAYADDVSSIQYFEHRGKVEVSTQGKRTSATTPFAIASVGKTMTSVALLRLVSNGQLGLDDMANSLLATDIVAGLGGLNGVTIRQLLNMTSGLPDYFTGDYIDDATTDPANVQNPQTALSYAYGERAGFTPGRGFEYSNTNYVLAGLILEKISGLSYADIIDQEIFKPARMTQSFVFGSVPLPPDFPFGHEDAQHERSYYQFQGFGDGGVISTAEDVARFYKALFIQKNLISPTLMSELTRDARNEGYGLGIEIDGAVYGHSGGDLGFSSDVRIDTISGAIAITLIAQSDADTSWTDIVLLSR